MNIKLRAIHQVLKMYKTVGQHTFDKPILARKAFEKLAKFVPNKNKKCSYQSFKIGEMEAEWICPNEANEEKVLLFFHGGGFATGSINTHRALISQIALQAGIKALAINYDLAPEKKFPTQIYQCANAYQFLLNEGYLAENIALGGESAGGGLTAGTLLFLKDHDLPSPCCAILLSPWLDLTASGDSMIRNKEKDPMVPFKGIPLWAKNYAGKNNLKNPYASPLFGELANLPPLYIQAGDHEILEDDATRFALKAKKAGVTVKLEIWKDMFHAWQGFWMILPEAKEANRKLGKFLHEKLFATQTTEKIDYIL